MIFSTNRETLQHQAKVFSELGGFLFTVSDHLGPIKGIEYRAAGMTCGDQIADINNVLQNHPEQGVDIPLLEAAPVIAASNDVFLEIKALGRRLADDPD